MSPDEIHLVAPESSLQTPRLLLEPLKEHHATLIYQKLQDERLYRYIPQNPPASLQTLKDRHVALSSRRSPDGREAWLNWAVRLLGSGDYAGTIEATVHENLGATIAYTVFVPYQRQGFAAEACGRLLEHLFEDYRVGVAAAEIDTRNVASISLVESLGFRRVAFQKDADHFKGSSSDEYRYELGGSVWREGRVRPLRSHLPWC